MQYRKLYVQYVTHQHTCTMLCVQHIHSFKCTVVHSGMQVLAYTQTHSHTHTQTHTHTHTDTHTHTHTHARTHNACCINGRHLPALYTHIHGTHSSEATATALELGTYALSQSFSHASHRNQLRSFVPHHSYVLVTGVPLYSDT